METYRFLKLAKSALNMATKTFDFDMREEFLNQAEKHLRKAIGSAMIEGQRKTAGLALVALNKVRVI